VFLPARAGESLPLASRLQRSSCCGAVRSRMFLSNPSVNWLVTDFSPSSELALESPVTSIVTLVTNPVTTAHASLCIFFSAEYRATRSRLHPIPSATACCVAPASSRAHTNSA
jgi:hypothetical protein